MTSRSDREIDMSDQREAPTAGARAQTAVEGRLPADAHIGRARFRVADLERSVSFYRDLLGMRVVRTDGRSATLAASGAARGAEPADGRELLVLREVGGLTRRPRRPVTTGLYHVAFLVPSRAELGRTLLGLHASGYPLRGMSDHAVSESLYLDDPDGNGLEIYADRPREAWPFRNGVIQLTTDPMDVDGVLAAAGPRTESWLGLPRETVIGHVHFTVSQLEPSVAFYRDVIGFDEMMRIPSLAAVSAGGYHHHLNLNTWAGEGAPRDADHVAGLDAWELVVADDDARGALADRMAAGRWGGPGVGGDRLTTADPDGIPVDVVGRPAGAER